MRKPRVENKYHLKPNDIERAVVLDEKRMQNKPFYRNDSINGYIISADTSHSREDYKRGTYNRFWVSFNYNNSVELSLYAYGDKFSYTLEEFFNPLDIRNEDDLEIQEKLLYIINWMIDEEIIKIKE